MNDPQQERRCRLAAWWIGFWIWIFVLLLAYHIVTVDFRIPPGWWLPFLMWAARKQVVKGEGLGSALAFSLFILLLAVGALWGLVDGVVPAAGRSQRWLLSFAASQILLAGITARFLWQAYRHAPRPERPERTEAQRARHAQLAGLVLLAGGIGAVALVVTGISIWQELGGASDPLKCYAAAALVGWLAWMLSRMVRGGIGVPAVTALLLPLLIGGVIAGVVMLVIFPVPSQRWFLALAYLVAASVALVISMRAILGGERKGQGDAG